MLKEQCTHLNQRLRERKKRNNAGIAAIIKLQNVIIECIRHPNDSCDLMVNCVYLRVPFFRYIVSGYCRYTCIRDYRYLSCVKPDSELSHAALGNAWNAPQRRCSSVSLPFTVYSTRGGLHSQKKSGSWSRKLVTCQYFPIKRVNYSKRRGTFPIHTDANNLKAQFIVMKKPLPIKVCDIVR